jgi:two-component system OmpR family sensor kinase
LAAQSHEGETAISVSDNGCGISAVDLPHIFEKFYRGHPSESFFNASNGEEPPQAPGVGLGLYLARTLVNRFGGRIAAESGDSRGATFTVYLPTARSEKEPNEELQDVETVAHS